MPIPGAPCDFCMQLLTCSSSQCCWNSLLFAFFCALVFYSACTMTARRTNNSLSASLDRENSPPDTLLHAQSSVPSSPDSAANSVPQSSFTVAAPVTTAGVHDPTQIATFVNAVKASLAAEKGPGSTSLDSPGNTASVALQSAFGVFPPHCPACLSKR